MFGWMTGGREGGERRDWTDSEVKSKIDKRGGCSCSQFHATF